MPMNCLSIFHRRSLNDEGTANYSKENPKRISQMRLRNNQVDGSEGIGRRILHWAGRLRGSRTVLRNGDLRPEAEADRSELLQQRSEAVATASFASDAFGEHLLNPPTAETPSQPSPWTNAGTVTHDVSQLLMCYDSNEASSATLLLERMLSVQIASQSEVIPPSPQPCLPLTQIPSTLTSSPLYNESDSPSNATLVQDNFHPEPLTPESVFVEVPESDPLFALSVAIVGEKKAFVDCGGEGDCLFRSVAFALWGDPDRHLEVRKLLVQFVDTHRGQSAVGVQAMMDEWRSERWAVSRLIERVGWRVLGRRQSDFELYIVRMARKGEYADAVMVSVSFIVEEI
ncbi:hypothetical protein HDU93_009795 [Gonapodya sp. JEL0774]|nr:hypothetical protein HDU93_009795 [Gonapodya sp. JEL0774]